MKYLFKFCYDCGAAIDFDSSRCSNCGIEEDAQSQHIEGTFKNDVSSIFGVVGKELDDG